MKKPKYEPLKMGNKEHADNYGVKLGRYIKWEAEQQRIIRDPRDYQKKLTDG